MPDLSIDQVGPAGRSGFRPRPGVASVVAEPGDIISGWIRLAGLPETDSGPRPRGVRVELKWSTHGRGDTDSAEVGEVMLPAAADGSVDAGFRLTVPPTAPISYRGELVSIEWTLRAVVDLPRRRDRKADFEVVVAPIGGRFHYSTPHPARELGN